jgi:hypothetical protein
MEGQPTISKAAAAIGHTLEQISRDPTLGYLCGLGSQTFALLTEAFAAIHIQDVDNVRTEFLPRAAKDPRETYGPVPINSSNCFGEGEEISMTFGKLSDSPFDEDDWVQYQELLGSVEALCEAYASRECATAPRLATPAQQLAAIRAKLESSGQESEAGK